jgi:hypothetical protein
MTQTVQELKTKVRMKSTYSKAEVIAVSRSIHKSSKGNVWMVEGSKAGSFYRVMYDEEFQQFVCDCKAFEYGMLNCKHILACAIHQKEVS